MPVPMSARSSRRRVAMGVLDDTSNSNAIDFDFEGAGSPVKGQSNNSDSAQQPVCPPSSSKKSKKGRRESKLAMQRMSMSGTEQPHIDASSSELSNLDGSNLGHITAYISDLSDEVDLRCHRIQNTAETACLSLRNSLQIALMKIPKSVRRMTVKEFEEVYGGEVFKVVQSKVTSELDEVLSRARAQPSTPGNNKRTNSRITRSVIKGGRPMETPSKGSGGGYGGVPQTPATVRAPRRGEVLLSENGSPIAQNDTVIATVKKAKKNDGSGQVTSAICLEMDAGNGQFINLGDHDAAKGMDEEMKKNAVSKLKNLQDEVAALMAQLGN
ncbi:hypothetical protein TrLO_g9575 [Triparma laevis f. longispina]|uniref:Borealin N-terminal domain-containing protein n=1 Tax=Triparma laevis f. longispina TaxID=1714387 RepID=A0A9W6ZEF4_9STRA|nr:hypothetical protein TrLO_g9575 [Triparma laevis f. longispina]